MYEKGVHLYIFHLKAIERSPCPGYQRFFLAYDEELRRPQAEDTETEKPLAPRVRFLFS